MASCALVSSADIVLKHPAYEFFVAEFGNAPVAVLSVPGRVNLIGEHIDYHNLPVLPMAIQQSVSIAYRARPDSHIQANSLQFGVRRLSIDAELAPSPSGDWVNYIKAAVRAVHNRWRISLGIDAAVTSDLAPAAGLSSSSALLTAFALALLHANNIHPTIAELMSILPEGEHFVGTRGGGMDHAAVLASQAGSALLVHFTPLHWQTVALPSDWRFLVAHSLRIAEKSGAAKLRYNACRAAGQSALLKLHLPSFQRAIQQHSRDTLLKLASDPALDGTERDAFAHVVSEALRVREAVQAIQAADLSRFGSLLAESHRSLRDQLQVSSPALDRLVQIALDSGADGARLTGAGFGGCVIVVCRKNRAEQVRTELIRHFYAGHPSFDPQTHLLAVLPSNGALSSEHHY